MRLSSIVLSWALVATGCGGTSAETDGAGAAVPSDSATLLFDQAGTLAIAPGEIASISVRTDPPAAYDITFALVGDALDASLDRTSARAEDDGRVTVMMRAPSQATSFVLRASIEGGASADLQIAVSDQGFGSLVVVPQYGGQRPVGTWHAGVLSGTTCEALADKLPQDPDGALSVEADENEPLLVEVAPVGPSLAVYVRAGHYMWGCSNETDLEPNETKTIQVHIVNEPIDASEMLLALELEFAPEPMPWATVLSEGATALFAELGATVPASDLLLAAMQAVATDPAGFDAAAVQYAWPTSLETYFLQNQIDLVALLSGYGTSGLSGEPPTIAGKLEAIDQAPGHALFELATIGSAGPSELAFPASNVLTFDVAPDDVVHVGGELFFLPGVYVAHVIESEALAQTPQADSMADVLDTVVMCDQLPLTGMTTCSDACMKSLCLEGLAHMWQSALGAASGTSAEIAMQISGAAEFDDVAALTGFEGTWLGAVKHQGVEASVTGAVKAEPVGPGPG